MTQEAYFEKLSYALRRRELLPRPMEEDGLLPVEWNGRILCRVTERGAIRYDPTWVDTDRAKAALAQVAEAAGTVMDYMTLLEAAAGGLPVFFCDPDMREVVPRAGAICADDPTPTAMAAALQGLLAHPERIAAMSAAMLKFRPQVAESVQIDKMLKAYQRLCG